MEYNVDYFINKFEAIPEEEIKVGSIENHCSLWHCKCEDYVHITEEAQSLIKLLSPLVPAGHLLIARPVWEINDGISENYLQPTPKQRILAALYDIKSLQAVKQAEEIIKEPVLESAL